MGEDYFVIIRCGRNELAYWGRLNCTALYTQKLFPLLVFVHMEQVQ